MGVSENGATRRYPQIIHFKRIVHPSILEIPYLWTPPYRGVSENRLNPQTQWFCWSLSLWKMAISLGILTQHFQTNPYGWLMMVDGFWVIYVYIGNIPNFQASPWQTHIEGDVQWTSGAPRRFSLHRTNGVNLRHAACGCRAWLTPCGHSQGGWPVPPATSVGHGCCGSSQ